MERKDEKGFCCEICMMVMERGRVPRMLPCGHSFCSDCLKKRRERESNLRCSNCGEVFEGEFVESFEVNELIPKMVDILLSSHILLVSDRPEEASFCANFSTCGQKTQMFCSQCQLFICDSCNTFHESTFFTRNHQRRRKFTSGQLQQEEKGEEEKELQPQSPSSHHPQDQQFTKMKRCLKHSSEGVSGYCFECSSLVCVRCILGGHVNHQDNVHPLEESAQKRRKQVSKFGEEIGKRIERIQKEKETNDVEIRNLEEKLKELREKLVGKEGKKKELERGLNDLRMRFDTINRLSQTPKDELILEEEVYSTLLDAAEEIVVDCCVGAEKRTEEKEREIKEREIKEREEREREEKQKKEAVERKGMEKGKREEEKEIDEFELNINIEVEEEDEDEEYGCIEEILPSRSPPPTPDQQSQAMAQIEPECTMKEGDLWYLIHSFWWNQWKEYTKDEEAKTSPDHPGEINNFPLCDEKGQLRRDVTQKSDFELLHEKQWKLLSHWYGGGPEISRRVIQSGSHYRSQFEVEIYLLRVELVLASSNEIVIESFSSQDTVRKLAEKAMEDFGVTEGNFLLWDYHGGAKIKALDDLSAHLSDHRIMDSQQILVEEKKETENQWSW